MAFRINEVWAFVAIGDDGDEGICGTLGKDGTWLPLVCADKTRLEIMRPVAENIAKTSGKKIKLIKLHQREDMEEILPFAPSASTN